MKKTIKLQSKVILDIPKLITEKIEFDFEQMFQYGLKVFKDYNDDEDNEFLTDKDEVIDFLTDDFLNDPDCYFELLKIDIDYDYDLWNEHDIFSKIEDAYSEYLKKRLKNLKFKVEFDIND